MENAVEYLKRFRSDLQDRKTGKGERPPEDSCLFMTLGEFRDSRTALLIRSHLIGEDIFLISNPECFQKFDGKYVTYTLDELKILCSAPKESIRWLHNLKKLLGGEFVGKGSIENEKNLDSKIRSQS